MTSNTKRDFELEVAGAIDESLNTGIPQRIQHARIDVSDVHRRSQFSGNWKTTYDVWIAIGEEHFMRECATIAEAEMFIGDTIMAQYKGDE